MNHVDIDGLRHWNFVQLFRNNEEYYSDLYKKTHELTKRKINREPTGNDMIDAMVAELIEEDNFIDHCESKKSYNPKWNQICAEKLAEYIVFRLYGKIS